MKSLGKRYEERRRSLQAFEERYGLPGLVGTERQRMFAALVRHEYLRDVFAGVMDATAALEGETATAVYRSLDRVRGERRANYGIDGVWPHLGEAVAHLLSLPAAEAAKRERERQRKAAEGRRIARAADEFAERNGLPRLVSPVASQVQESHGRRCRYEILTALPAADLEAVLPRLREVSDAGVWIGARREERPIEYVLGRADTGRRGG